MIFGEHDEKTMAQYRDVASRAAYTALMADGHMGYVMPIGGVAAYRNQVSVTGVGFDIGCGNMAVCVGKHGDLPWEEIADEIADAISFGVGQTNPNAPKDHPLFNDPAWDIIPKNFGMGLKMRARNQLGTVGGGNHYVDLFEDEQGCVWIGNHFGSRGFGHTVASAFLAIGTGSGTWGDRASDKEEVLLDLTTQVGQDYMALMELAGRYASAGREWVISEVLRVIFGVSLGDTPDPVHNHHNYAWREKHFGEDLIVVRKGATPAWPGQEGFVGSSMGGVSVILRGSEHQGQVEGEAIERQRAALFSTVHGAGRVMGRMQAKGKWKKGKLVRPGLIDHQMMREATKGVVIRGGDLDEAPQAYRDLDEVLDAQGDTIEVQERLHPRVVCMAPARTVDPYKD